MSLFWVKIIKTGLKLAKFTVRNTRNLEGLVPFLTQKTPLTHFLVLCVFFAVLIVVFGNPVGLLDFTARLSGVNPQLQVAVTTMVGLLTLAASRAALYFVARRHSIAPMGCLIWLFAELIAIIAVLCLVLWQISGGGRLMLAPLAADLLLGIIAIEAMPYVISALVFRLREEQQEVVRLQEQLEQLQVQDIPSAGASGERTINFHDRVNRLVFSTAGNNILYIEAADNYVNIHYLNEGHEDTFILHNTLKEMEKRLANTALLRCHRGYMVNIDNVKLLRKEGASLLLELNGSTKTIPVTKTYAASITARIAPEND